MEDILLKTRTIFLNDDIDAQQAQGIALLMRHFDKQSKPITLIINSEGGEVASALAIADAIMAARNRVVGLVQGACYSAAGIVLQVCDKRLMSPSSLFMIHEGTTTTGRVAAQELDQAMRAERLLSQQADDLLYRRAKLSRVALKALSNQGTYFTPAEALKAGFIDAVATPRRKRK